MRISSYFCFQKFSFASPFRAFNEGEPVGQFVNIHVSLILDDNILYVYGGIGSALEKTLDSDSWHIFGRCFYFKICDSFLEIIEIILR